MTCYESFLSSSTVNFSQLRLRRGKKELLINIRVHPSRKRGLLPRRKQRRYSVNRPSCYCRCRIGSPRTSHRFFVWILVCNYVTESTIKTTSGKCRPADRIHSLRKIPFFPFFSFPLSLFPLFDITLHFISNECRKSCTFGVYLIRHFLTLKYK